MIRLFRSNIECYIMSKEEEKEKIHKEVVEWIDKNDKRFKENCKNLYDKDNLEKIKRFAGAPIEYINERLEMNKEVAKSYHKIHQSILLAGLTAFYAVLLTQIILSIVNASEITYNFYLNISLLMFLIIAALLAPRFRLTYKLMKFVGLLRVILDSEIEVYYLSKIKEYRESSQDA